MHKPVHFGEVVVNHNDLIVGDADGVVVIPHERVAEVLDKAQAREDTEAAIIERIAQGETTMDIYHLPQ